MPIKLSPQDKFRAKARAVHGDLYDYSLSIYLNSKTKIIIICKEHGRFEQTPVRHLQGAGCKSCAFLKASLTQQQFEDKAKKVHGNRYDYSESIYKSLSTKLTIICREHGRFTQLPSAHLSGSGCRKCNNIRIPITQEQFEAKARQVHGNRYDYSQSVYLNPNTKVTIRCTQHGNFEKYPFSHIKGLGCPDCTASEKADTFRNFKAKARIVHGQRYDYSQVKYISYVTKVKIICKEHGSFNQTPDDHMHGLGCPSCHDSNVLVTKQQFETKARAVHGDRYDYSRTSYDGLFEKVTIICKEHGRFELVPVNHLQGAVCPACAPHGAHRSRKAAALELQKQLTNRHNFESKARAVHGDRYDYSQAIYLNTATNLTIICKEHGPFNQTPSKHLSGSGCRHCNTHKSIMTIEKFKAKAKSVHSNQYDYSQAVYGGFDSKIRIICKEHGLFEMAASRHLQGVGCLACRTTSIVTQDDFISKAIQVHGDYYDYSNSVYNGIRKPIEILCKKHGLFKQTASAHLRGAHCPNCKVMMKYKNSFVAQAKLIHGHYYDYSETVYEGSFHETTILCKKHGSFKETPHNHLKGSGCLSCSAERQLIAQQNFEAKAREIHGDQYDYTQYDKSADRILILCKEHGSFTLDTSLHLLGVGCPSCQFKNTPKAKLRQFKANAKEVHGDRYDYAQVSYKGPKTKVKIICKEHGSFNQLPDDHLSGSGCPACHGKDESTLKNERRVAQFNRFEAKAKKIHNGRYDYSQSIYVDSKTKITILCKEHGAFERTPLVHLVGLGCPNCPSISKLNYG